MAKIITLPSNCSTDDIVEVLDQDGGDIVNGFVTQAWLNDFNTSVQTSVDNYKPYDYGEPEAS